MRKPSPLILIGSGLLLAGLLLWQAAPSIDLAVFRMLRLDAGQAGVDMARPLTDIGGFAVLGPFALLVIAWLLVRRRPMEALWLFVTIGAGRLAIEAMKALIARPRPPLVDRLAEVSSLSFPSSHSAGTLMTWLALAMLFPRLRSWLLPFAFAMALMIGWTRVALGVHWPSDVLAGYGVAMIAIGLACRWLPVRPINPA